MFKDIGGITHTHSKWATIYAQAGRPIRPMGTTHADYFLGAVPCTRSLKQEETICEYEKNTGLVIAEAFQGKDSLATPGVLVRNHGPFTWGKSPYDAVYNAVVLEQIAFMNWHAEKSLLTIFQIVRII